MPTSVRVFVEGKRYKLAQLKTLAIRYTNKFAAPMKVDTVKYSRDVRHGIVYYTVEIHLSWIREIT